MQAPLLSTKLNIPPARSGQVERPRLQARLREGLKGKLTLISAPPGFGKTTLLATWARGCGLPVAWVSLDPADNDAGRFLAHLVAALQRLRPAVGAAALAVMQSDRMPGMDAPGLQNLIEALINDIALDPQPLVLVLDDYHLIQDAEIQAGVAFLLEHLPQGMHVCLVTRADPPFPLARLRSQGQVSEIRSADLRFSVPEVGLFLNEIMGLDLSFHEVSTLDQRTEGWAAGLQLAALSLKGRKNAGDFIAAFSGSNRYILDYLVEEVLNRQPRETQEFLLLTSILDQLCAPLCNALTGEQDAQTHLEQLEQSNVFLVALDEERRWYRYHHLFGDLLRARLQQTLPGWILTLHRRASQWYEANEERALAVKHALAGEDWERAARLVEQDAFALVDHGEMNTLLGWLKALPAGVVRTHPLLCVAHAWVLTYMGMIESTGPFLVDAEKALDSSRTPDGPRERHIRALVTAVRAFSRSLSQDLVDSASQARDALQDLPESDYVTRSIMQLVISISLRRAARLDEAARSYEETISISKAGGRNHVAMLGAIGLAGIMEERGLRKQEYEIYQKILLEERASTLPGGAARVPVLGLIHSRMADLLCVWDRLEEAAHHARLGIEISRQWGQAEFMLSAHLSMAEIHTAQGDFSAAWDEIQKARQSRGELPWVPRLSITEMYYWLARGDLEKANQWALDNGLAPSAEASYGKMVTLTGVADLALALGNTREALDLVERLLAIAGPAGANGHVLQLRVLRAMALQADGRLAEAMQDLEAALRLGEPQGYVRSFNYGKPMEELLRKVAERGICLEYVNRLLEAFHAQPAAPPPASLRPVVALPEPLSERELEVLRLLESPLSSVDIARELYISTHTVRSHIKSIYAKLDVHGRLEAVQRARQLHLL